MLSKLPNKTLLEILYRLTPVGLLKIRSISKTLSNLTKQCFFIAKYLRINTVTGFFYQEKACSDSKQLPDKPSFIPIEPQEGRLPDPHLNFLKQKNKIVQIQVIDSCNDGLLLCSGSRVGRSGLDKTWFVCNPLTMEKLALPHPRRQSCKSIYALVADFTSSGYLEFKVLCLFGPKKGDPNSKLSIFSLETGEWEEVEECPPPLCDKFSMGSKVFFNGRLLWDCLQDQILICHLNSKNQKCPYELLEAPQAPLGRCLWGFEASFAATAMDFPMNFQLGLFASTTTRMNPSGSLKIAKNLRTWMKIFAGIWRAGKQQISQHRRFGSRSYNMHLNPRRFSCLFRIRCIHMN